VLKCLIEKHQENKLIKEAGAYGTLPYCYKFKVLLQRIIHELALAKKLRETRK